MFYRRGPRKTIFSETLYKTLFENAAGPVCRRFRSGTEMQGWKRFLPSLKRAALAGAPKSVQLAQVEMFVHVFFFANIYERIFGGRNGKNRSIFSGKDRRTNAFRGKRNLRESENVYKALKKV